MRLVLALVLTAAGLTAAGIPPREYQERRAELRKSLDGVMVLFGAEDPDDLHTSFFQESNFLYLSGWREPGAIMLLTPQDEILFLPPRDRRLELYTGAKLDPTDPEAPKKTGFERVIYPPVTGQLCATRRVIGSQLARLGLGFAPGGSRMTGL